MGHIASGLAWTSNLQVQASTSKPPSSKLQAKAQDGQNLFNRNLQKSTIFHYKIWTKIIKNAKFQNLKSLERLPFSFFNIFISSWYFRKSQLFERQMIWARQRTVNLVTAREPRWAMNSSEMEKNAFLRKIKERKKTNLCFDILFSFLESFG